MGVFLTFRPLASETQNRQRWLRPLFREMLDHYNYACTQSQHAYSCTVVIVVASQSLCYYYDKNIGKPIKMDGDNLLGRWRDSTAAKIVYIEVSDRCVPRLACKLAYIDNWLSRSGAACVHRPGYSSGSRISAKEGSTRIIIYMHRPWETTHWDYIA